MKKILSYICFLGVSLLLSCWCEAGLLSNPDPNTLWLEQFEKLELNDDRQTGWGNFDPDQVSVELVDGRARLREVTPVSWGILQRYVPVDTRPGSNYRYLQIRVAAIEDIGNCLLLGNANTGGTGMGKMFAGVTTIDLAAQPGYGTQGSIALTLTMLGPDGVAPGGWLDVDWIRCVRTPVGGLTFDLVERGKPNNTAELGETILLRYYAGDQPLERPVEVQIYLASKMLPYSFDGNETVVLRDDGTNGDEKAGDRIYSKAIVIGPEALSLVSPPPTADAPCTLVATARAGTELVHAYSAFRCDIKTAQKFDDVAVAWGTPETVRNRLLWMRETKGENLALGRPVRFSLEPDYGLTKAGGSDTRDLTDGRLADRGDDKIWFSPGAVGWFESSRPTLGLNMLIDLGSVQPVGKVVARMVGGAEQGCLLFPAEFMVVASDDGKVFHKVGALNKLAPAERYRSGEAGNYYLPEDGNAYTYPFVFPLQVKARYIGLYVRGAADAVFCDEVVVIKGDFPDDKAEPLANMPVVSFVTEGLVFSPGKPILAISTNIVTPNFFRILDCRPMADRAKPATCVIELPEQVRILSAEVEKSDAYQKRCGWAGMPPVAKAGAATELNGRRMVRWSFPMANTLMRHPLFLTVDGVLPPDSQAVFHIECEGVAPNRVTVPILPISIPKVPKLEGFHVSLAWMDESNPLRWPDFFDAWEHLGFDTVSTFPRYWGGKVAPEVGAWLDEARRRGFKVLYNESPFHVMVGAHPDEPEIYGQLPGGPSKAPCPAYRGKFYQEEIKRVGDCYELTNPDLVFWDIELWYDGGREAGSCSRCLEWQKKSGKPMEECLVEMGTGMLKDMHDEIQSRATKLGRKMPILAMYDLRAADKSYQFVHSFKAAYPEYLQWSQPSLYCLNNLPYAHSSMQDELEALGGKKGVIVPWLTAGTYGEADPWTIEALILESFLNGATGITYYYYNDFDSPLDFQAHAKALCAIAPHQALLREGRHLDLSVKSEIATPKPSWWQFWRKAEPGAPVEGILPSAWWNGKDEMLLLLGNYSSSRTVRVRPENPFARIKSVTDAFTGEKLDAGLPLEIDVPGSGFRLVHIKGVIMP